MSPFWRQHYDKLLLILALSALGGGWAWGTRQLPPGAAAQSQYADPERAVATFARRRQPTRAEPAAPWTEPHSQKRGEGWRYELFAPPSLQYEASSGGFIVRPGAASQGLPQDRPPDWKLVAVKRLPYRLQYAGYFGSPADPRVAFTSPSVPAPVILRPGERLPNLAVTLVRFEPGRRAERANVAGAVDEVVATAVLYDEELGQEVELDSRSTRFTETALAVVVDTAAGRTHRELRVGDTLGASETEYRIESIRLDPAEVVLSPLTPAQAGSGPVVLRQDRPGRPSTAGPLEAMAPGAERVAVNQP